MAARAEARDEVGELSEALRAEIKAKIGEKTVYFFNETDFGDAGAVFFAEKLRGNTVVEKITLACAIGAVGARALAEAVGEDNITLKGLDLFQNPSVGDDGAEFMALMLGKNTTLEDLNLGSCGVGERGGSSSATCRRRIGEKEAVQEYQATV